MARVAGRYELGALLGSGGFASVYRALDTASDREVAVKIIPFGTDGSASFDRFRHEALALSRLKSRHTARVHDFGRDDAVGFYLVMEYIDGVELDVQALGRVLLPHEVLRTARGLMTALAEAHDLGIIHRDIKPSNVLVPRGLEGLFELRLLDFGIARTERRTQVREAMGQADTQKGLVLGTPAYMAPEQLVDGTTGAGADVYAAGLVLFDLLGLGPLFPGEKIGDQMAGRLRDDPHVDARVPGPLGVLLARMLERDPLVRFANGREALMAIGDLETAPVALDELVQASARLETGAAVPSRIPRAIESRPPTSRGAVSPVAVRLTHLDADATGALKQALNALDFAMLDALGRRERGTELGRVARGIALAFRLELEAAALILEALSATSQNVQAVGAALVAPRARVSTRARIDLQKTDAWVDGIDPELAGMFACVATALTNQDDAARNEARCRRALARFPGVISPIVTTLHMALLTASSIAGNAVTSIATTEFIRLREGDSHPPSPFHTLMRAVMLGVLTFRADEHLSREQLERASQIAADCGVVLFEARALVAWGGMLVEIPGRVEEGLGVLERAATLLAHGDAPSLEHIA
ncbi:MAG: serine/threonine-protein kinase, partial [Polyangiaceae bacterium]